MINIDNISKKNNLKVNKLALKFDFEIIGVCHNCNTWWATIQECKNITFCESCNTGKYMEQVVRLDDVSRVLRKVK